MRIEKRLFFISSIALFISNVSMAGENLLATIYKTSDKSRSELILHTNDQEDITKVSFKVFNEDGELDSTINLSPSELKEGKEVLSKMGATVISLQSDNLSAYNGGDIRIRYLTKYRVFKANKYSIFEVLLDRIGDKWELSKDGERFNKLVAHTYAKGIRKFEIKPN